MVSGLESPAILMGGELTADKQIAAGYDDIYGPRVWNMSREEKTDYAKDLFGNLSPSVTAPYGNVENFTEDFLKTGNQTKKSQNKFKRPIPGVQSLDVSFQGGSRALRQATVSWTCWSFEDIDRLMPHFLSVGKTVMLEWGWVYDKNSLSQLPTFLDSKNNIKRNAYTDYKNTILDSNGDFDMMIGIVKNFEFNTRDDGGFDCTTTLSSMGVNVIDNPMPAKESVATAVRWDLSSNLTDSEIEEKSKEDNVDKLIKADVNITLKVLIENIDVYLEDKVTGSGYNIKKGYENIYKKSNTTRQGFQFLSSPNQFIVEFDTYNKTKPKKSTQGANKFVPLETVEEATFQRVSNAWVRWGWFEDNILSKFLSQVSSNSNIPTAEFRSVTRVEDTEGRQSNHYESTRIRNSPHLETVDTKRYILPGQFIPLVRPNIKGLDTKIKGDSEYIQKLSKMVNENFKKFTTGDVITRKEPEFYAQDDPIAASEGCDSNDVVFGTDGLGGEELQNDFEAMTKEELELFGIKKREVVKTRPAPTKHGFMRNMLINTKVIKEAFGVNEGGVETVNVREALESLFSLLNQDINFWKFELRNDDYETYRTKIIDTSITEELPKDGEVIRGTTNPLPTTKSIYNKTTDEVTNNGVFFFPVWQHNSIVKRQNVQATLPNAMAVSIMYGANADIATTLGDTPAEVGTEEGVAMGKLGDVPDNKDKKMKNLNIALHQEGYERYGTKSASDNVVAITKKGGDDNIINWLKKNPELIAGNYKEKQQVKDEAIQAQKQLAKETADNNIIDNAVPPPIPTPISNLTDEQWKSLGKKIKGSHLKDETLLDLYSSKYDKKNKLKEKFIESIKYNTTHLVTTKNTSEIDKTVLLPLNLELDIDGIGGIYPNNSFHSTYVPLRYQNNTVFQIFDVNHTIDSTGWTTAIKGKMRSSVSRVTESTITVKKILDIKKQFTNAKEASDKKSINENEVARKVAVDKQINTFKAGTVKRGELVESGINRNRRFQEKTSKKKYKK